MQHGTILIHPVADQICIEGKENLTSYTFGRCFQSHEFCRICGVSVYIRRLNIEKKEWEKYFGKSKSLDEWKKRCPLNLRCFEGVEWEEVKKCIWRDVGE